MSERDFNWDGHYAGRAERMQASEIRELLKILDRPDVISFAGGIPDPALFPKEAFADAYASVMADAAKSSQALQYSVSEGYAPLKEWIRRHMASRGVACELDNIVITSGSQQGLEFLGRVLLSPNDTALVTAPTYLGALQAFNAYEPTYLRLDLDGGNQTAEFYREEAKSRGGRIKFAYVVPDFANPSGETMTRKARIDLLDLADELDTLVIEDAAYSQLRYDGEPVDALQAIDIERTGAIDSSRVVYCGTFSKTLAPALRVGWVCAARPLIDKLVLIKQASDLHSATINQMAAHQVAEACFDDQVAKARTTYRQRRDAMLAALERHMPPGVSWTRPEGGMFIWVTLPAGVDAGALLPDAVERAKAAYVPGAAFFAEDKAVNTMRLSFSLADEETIERGIGDLARLIAKRIAGEGAVA